MVVFTLAGTIVTVITLAGQAVNRTQLASVYLAALLVGAVTLPCLMPAPATWSPVSWGCS